MQYAMRATSKNKDEYMCNLNNSMEPKVILLLNSVLNSRLKRSEKDPNGKESGRKRDHTDCKHKLDIGVLDFMYTKGFYLLMKNKEKFQ